jgi:CO/xanthine dehydrogenase FAD-binding subunit
LVARIAVPIESERNPTALIKIVRQAEGFATIGVAALRSSTAESRLAFFGLNKAAWLLPGTARALDRNGWAQDSAIVEAKLREELAEFDELLPDPYRLHIAGVLLSRLCRGIGWE